MAGRQTGETGVEPVAAIPPLTLQTVAARATADHLEILGGFACENDPSLPSGTRTLLLLGPHEPGFWRHITAQPEWDGAADPMDRWSRRVVGRIAGDLGAEALFPFGGPPYHPFYTWALRTGRVWDSPVRLLVNETQGLMVSFRGALAFRERLALPATPMRPCDGCAKPCLTACPADALNAAGYDVQACHAFLNSAEGGGCMSQGCVVRRACPLSVGYARMPEQSAYHMRQFHR